MSRSMCGMLLQDVVAVGARELGQVDVAVVEPQVEALADEPLDHLDQRALAQVVGARP